MQSKTWLELNQDSGFDGESLELIILEAARTSFPDPCPPGFRFLNGSHSFVDLGFRYLGLSKEDTWAVSRAFAHHGVLIPGAVYKMKNVRPFYSYVMELEPGEDPSSFLSLPPHWRQGVQVMGVGLVSLYLGKMVPNLEANGFEVSLYEDIGDAWILKNPPPGVRYG